MKYDHIKNTRGPWALMRSLESPLRCPYGANYCPQFQHAQPLNLTTPKALLGSPKEHAY